MAVEESANGRMNFKAIRLDGETDLGIGRDGVWRAGEVAHVVDGDGVVAVKRERRDRESNRLRITEGGGGNGGPGIDGIVGGVRCGGWFNRFGIADENIAQA